MYPQTHFLHLHRRSFQFRRAFLHSSALAASSRLIISPCETSTSPPPLLRTISSTPVACFWVWQWSLLFAYSFLFGLLFSFYALCVVLLWSLGCLSSFVLTTFLLPFSSFFAHISFILPLFVITFNLVVLVTTRHVFVKSSIFIITFLITSRSIYRDSLIVKLASLFDACRLGSFV